MVEQRRTAENGEPLRILVVSDKIVSLLFGPQLKHFIGPVDVLLSCGDLRYTYLEFLVTQLHVADAFYVHGNHDAPLKCSNGKILEAPGGWVNVDRRAVKAQYVDLLVAGLEGSIRYKPNAPYQYTQTEMRVRAQRLILQLLFNRIFYGRYLDILIAHSPPAGIHDEPAGPHEGFEVFLRLMRRFRPRLFLHGHVHRYGSMPWRTRYKQTEIVNIYPFRVLNLYENHVEYERVHV